MWITIAFFAGLIIGGGLMWVADSSTINELELENDMLRNEWR